MGASSPERSGGEALRPLQVTGGAMKRKSLIALAVGSIIGAALPGAYADTNPPGVTMDQSAQGNSQQSAPGSTVVGTPSTSQSAPSAQGGDDVARDQRDISKDQGDIKSDRRDIRKDRADIRADRRDVWKDRRDLRRDYADLQRDL